MQDVLLQLAGASLAGLELLLVSPDTLRLTSEGRAEVERSRGSHLGQLLHPEVAFLSDYLFFIKPCIVLSRLAALVASLWPTLSASQSSPWGGRSAQPLPMDSAPSSRCSPPCAASSWPPCPGCSMSSVRSSGTGGKRWSGSRFFQCLTFFPGGSKSAFSVGGSVMPLDPGQSACPQASPHPVPPAQLLLLLGLDRRSPLLLIFLPPQTSPRDARHCLPTSQLHARPIGSSGGPAEDVHSASEVRQAARVQARGGPVDGEAEGGKREAGTSAKQIGFVSARTSSAPRRPQEQQAKRGQCSSLVPGGACRGGRRARICGPLVDGPNQGRPHVREQSRDDRPSRSSDGAQAGGEAGACFDECAAAC